MGRTVATAGELIGRAGVNICEQINRRTGGVRYWHKKRASMTHPLVDLLQAVDRTPTL